MDLVGRLKEYIRVTGIPVTQFADACNIPRPTISQILNGRNKKISDEIISKIHNAYPDLSVLWLMFGEGSMEFGENMKISEGYGPTDFNSPNLFSKESDIINVDTGKIKPETEKTFEKNQISIAVNSPTETVREIRKTITSIVVYYNDSSFQTFIPAKNTDPGKSILQT